MTDTTSVLRSAIARMQKIDRLPEEIGGDLPEPDAARRAPEAAALYDVLMAEATAAHAASIASSSR